MPHLATHEWPPRQTDAGAAAPVAVLVHGITGWWRTWWRVGPVLAAADGRSAIGGEQRAQLLAGVPSGSRALQLDSGHTIHRDRFDDYMATILDWLDEVRRA